MPNFNNTNENGLVYDNGGDKYLDREALAYTEALQQGILDDKSIHLYEFQHPENAQKIKESLGWNAVLNPEKKKAMLELVEKDIDEKADILETQFTTEISDHDKERIGELGGDVATLEEQLAPQHQMISQIRKNSVGKMAAAFTALSLSASLSSNAQENTVLNSPETTTQSTGSKEQAKKLTQEEFEVAIQNPKLFIEKSLLFEGSIPNEKIAEEIMKIAQQDPRLFLQNAYRYVGFKSEGFDLGKVITEAVDNPKAFGKSYEENGQKVIRIGSVTPELFVIHLDSLKNVPNLDLGGVLTRMFESNPVGFTDYTVLFEHTKELKDIPNFDLAGFIQKGMSMNYGYDDKFVIHSKALKEIQGLDVPLLLNQIGERNPQVFLALHIEIIKDALETPGFDLSKVILENPNSTYHRSTIERLEEKNIQVSRDVQKLKELIQGVPYFGEKSMYGLEALVNNVVRHNLSTEEARKITQDPYTLYKNLVNIKGEPNHLADHDVSMYLSQLSTKKIQTINSLHNSPDNVRFKSLEKFNAKELYTLMVYGEDEVFTSSFNGIFSRLVTKMQQEGVSGDKLLESVGQNKSRTFIKECAGYNRLDEFLATMDEQKQEALLIGVVQGIEKSSDPVLESVVVVDILGNLKNQPAVRKAIEDQIKTEYERTVKEAEQDTTPGSKKFNGSILYSVLGSVAGSQSGRDDAWFKEMKEKYPVPTVDLREVKNETLFNENNTNIQEYFFYNDDDGKSSFAHFLAQYENKPGWQIERQKDFVKIISKQAGKKIEIYANYPESNEAGAEAVQSFFTENNLVPTVVVHRGHSYHVNKTIQDLDLTAKIVSLGSCGGYNNVAKVLDKSPNAHILSTKGTGTMLINDPLLKMLNTQILEGKDIEWSVFWEALGGKVGKDERFKDYVSPNKNAGAVFIKAYKDAVLKEAQNSQK
jgi:hypothetical protein